MTDNAGLVERLEARVGQSFDGEATFDEAEVAEIAAALRASQAERDAESRNAGRYADEVIELRGKLATSEALKSLWEECASAAADTIAKQVQEIAALRESRRRALEPVLSSAELRLVDKHCEWPAFKHAFNAVMKARVEGKGDTATLDDS